MAYFNFLTGVDLTCRRLTLAMGYGFGVGKNRTNFVRYADDNYPTSFDWLDFRDSKITMLFNQGNAGAMWNAGENVRLIDVLNKIEYDMRLNEGEYFDKETGFI